MTTDGGGWTLVLNYDRGAGNNPPLTPAFPTSLTAQSHVTHLDNLGFVADDISEVRLFCTSSGHSRVVHFRTTNNEVLTSVLSGTSLPQDPSIWKSYTMLYDDHGGVLPMDTDYVGFTFADPAQLFGWDFPFYRDSGYEWSTGADGYHWHCDDLVQSSTDTVHRVFFRKSVPPVSAERSCKEIRDAGNSTGDGLYWIDPDGFNETGPYRSSAT